jgi:YgiT-type zinc finger domain-containing protein
MKCLSCKTGNPTPATTTFTAERNGVLVIVRHVPALVCNQCGEEYFEGKITDQLMQQIKDATQAGGQVNICEYAAA